MHLLHGIAFSSPVSPHPVSNPSIKRLFQRLKHHAASSSVHHNGLPRHFRSPDLLFQAQKLESPKLGTGRGPHGMWISSLIISVGVSHHWRGKRGRGAGEGGWELAGVIMGGRVAGCEMADWLADARWDVGQLECSWTWTCRLGFCDGMARNVGGQCKMISRPRYE